MKISVPELPAMEPHQNRVQRESDLLAGVIRPGHGLKHPPLTSSDI
jgi:hypothetical protein